MWVVMSIDVVSSLAMLASQSASWLDFLYTCLN